MAFTVLPTGSQLVLGMPFCYRFEPLRKWRSRAMVVEEKGTKVYLKADHVPRLSLNSDHNMPVLDETFTHKLNNIPSTSSENVISTQAILSRPENHTPMLQNVAGRYKKVQPTTETLSNTTKNVVSDDQNVYPD